MTTEQLETVNFLNRAFHLNNKIKALESIKDSNKFLSATNYERDGSSSGKNENGTENKMMKSLELSERIESDKLILQEIVREIYNLISNVENDEEYTILTYRYLCYMTIEQIAEAMSYSIRSVQNKHKKAITNIALICTLNV